MEFVEWSASNSGAHFRHGTRYRPRSFRRYVRAIQRVQTEDISPVRPRLSSEDDPVDVVDATDGDEEVIENFHREAEPDGSPEEVDHHGGIGEVKNDA